LSKSLSRREILGGLLHRLGYFEPINFENDFNERLILQKTLYLMQCFGLYIGYGFSWYIRGPYSPALTKDAYSLVSDYEELPMVAFVRKVDEDKFEKFLSFLGNNLNNEEWLECVASIHFLYNNESRKDKGYIFSKIKNKMPNLDEILFDKCWKYLEEYEMIEG